VNRQRQVHFETLRTSAFYTMFQTIRICAHCSSLPVSDALEAVNFNSSADRTREEVPNRCLTCGNLAESSH
jgi:hypothetical protein